MKNILLPFVTIIISGLILWSCDNSSEPISNDISWIMTYGGTGNDLGTSIILTDDEGYIISGYTDSYGSGSTDAWIIKTDHAGTEIWSNTYGGSNLDWASSIEKTDDGGYIFAGGTMSFGNGLKDAYLVKIDSIGNEVWSKTFGGTNDDLFNSVSITSDSGFILVGETSSFGYGGEDIYIVKSDSEGNEIWSKTFGGSNNDWARSAQQTSDGGFIIIGTTRSYGNDSQILMIKIDSQGNQIWLKTFGEAYYEYGGAVQQTSDGGYIITGSTELTEFVTEVILIKTDSLGNLSWEKTFKINDADFGYSVMQTDDGGYIISGATGTDAKNTFYDVFLLKTNSSGTKQWLKTFGGSDDDSGVSVKQTTGGGYIIIGSNKNVNNDVYLIKTDENGNIN